LSQWRGAPSTRNSAPNYLSDYLCLALPFPNLALRFSYRNGPTGGNFEDVLVKKTPVAGTDAVALDAYVAKAYWNLDPPALAHLKMAADRGLGTLEFDKLPTQIVALPSTS
jgi:hypothetical protein